MKDTIKNLIRSKCLDYLKLKISSFKVEKKLFTCPLCQDKNTSANFVPKSNYKIYCFKCGYLGDIFRIIKKLEKDKQDWTDDQIADYLQETLKVEDVNVFDIYKNYKWSLLPLAKNTKKPIETSWTNNLHYGKQEWLKWLYAGHNLGLRTGKVCGITVLDIDKTELTIDINLAETLHQKTAKGNYHLIYKYDSDLNALKANKQLKKELDMDIRNDGNQIVIEPSKIGEKGYKWVNLGQEITNIPIKVKEQLLKYVAKPTKDLPEPTLKLPEREAEDLIPVIPDSSEIKKLGKGLRNGTLVSIGGRLRNKYKLADTIYLLDFINRTFCNPPLPRQEIVNMVKSLKGYQENDELTIAKQIYEYARQQGDITSRDAKESLNISKGIVDKYLSQFAKEGKLIRLGRGRYRYREKIEWSEDIPAQIKGIDIVVPYFNDVSYFESGDIILIGSGGKQGKTTIALNLIKRLVDQGVKPYYLYSESGSRFKKIITTLGLKNGDFYHAFNLNPLSIELEKNAVTILDWLLITDKSLTDTIFKHLTEEMQRKGGLLFVFMQLKEDNRWFAPNMVKQFPALATRYIYDENSSKVGAFKIDAIRDPKGDYKIFTIPCIYDFKTKILNIKEEIEDDQ